MTMTPSYQHDDTSSTQEGPLLVPLARMDHTRSHSKPPSSSPPSWKTKKLLMCASIIGRTAAVASSTFLLFFFFLSDFPKHERRFGKNILAGTPAAIALLRLTTTTTVDHNHGPNDDRYVTLPDDDDDASNGPDDDTCVPAAGPWPTGSTSYAYNDSPPSGPYVTCFSLLGSKNQCWSHSHYASGVWKPCTPNGYGGATGTGWVIEEGVETSGTGCQEFS